MVSYKGEWMQAIDIWKEVRDAIIWRIKMGVEEV